MSVIDDLCADSVLLGETYNPCLANHLKKAASVIRKLARMCYNAEFDIDGNCTWCGDGSGDYKHKPDCPYIANRVYELVDNDSAQDSFWNDVRESVPDTFGNYLVSYYYHVVAPDDTVELCTGIDIITWIPIAKDWLIPANWFGTITAWVELPKAYVRQTEDSDE